MEIRFASKKLEKISLDGSLVREYVKSKGVQDLGKAVLKIQLALTHLDAAENMHEIPEVFRPHPLVANFRGHYGLSVTNTHRLLLKPDHDDQPDFNWENTRSITRVTITHLCMDYHTKKKEVK